MKLCTAIESVNRTKMTRSCTAKNYDYCKGRTILSYSLLKNKHRQHQLLGLTGDFYLIKICFYMIITFWTVRNWTFKAECYVQKWRMAPFESDFPTGDKVMIKICFYIIITCWTVRNWRNFTKHALGTVLHARNRDDLFS